MINDCEKNFIKEKNEEKVKNFDIVNQNNLAIMNNQIKEKDEASKKLLDSNNSKHSQMMSITTALFYGICSFLILVINKIILTVYKFPSYHILGFGQMVATMFILFLAKNLNILTYPSFKAQVIKKIFPLPLFYVGNLIFGLGGTKRLSLPMFTVLRRFTILMTLIGEYFILKTIRQRSIVISIISMIIGALIAASNDLSFDLQGYAFVLSNDFFTAANGVYIKKKLDSRDLGKFGLLFYNCLFMSVPILLISFFLGDIEKVLNYEFLYDFWFLSSYFLSCVMGFLLMYSTMLCTSYNSALTTTIVGCLKNIIVTYIGMYIGGDYIFSITNFIGLNISMVASLFYSYITFIRQPTTT